MAMRFSYRDRTATSGRRRLIYATAGVIALLLIDVITGGSIRSFVRDTAGHLSNGFHAAGERISAGGYFTSHAALASENESLKAQLATLQERAALATALQAQVTALSSLTHLAAAQTGITVPIASSFIASPYGTFLIGAGVDQGILRGSIVLSQAGTVIGSVTDVGPHTATVTELFAPGKVIDAQLDGASIVVHGAGGGNATSQVPRGLKIVPGDAVIAPGFNGRVVGIVGHVDSDPSNAAIQVYIGSPVNLASLSYVFVVQSQQ